MGYYGPGVDVSDNVAAQLALTLSQLIDNLLTNGASVADGAVTDAKVAASAAIAQSKIAGLVADLAAKQAGFVPTAVKTANYAAAVQDYVLVDATAASRTVTLPTAPADKSRIGVKMVAVSGAFVTTVACGGADKINLPTGSASATLTVLNQSAIFQYVAATATWTVQSGDLPLSSIDARFAGLAGPFAPAITGASAATRYVGGTASGAPTTGTFAVGDYIIDRTGFVWICTGAGTPGTWAQAGGAMPLTGTQTTTTRKAVFSLQPSTAGVGAFAASSAGTDFAGTIDYVYDHGYNARKAVATEPSWTDTVEHDFNESGFHWVEAYKEFFGKDAVAKTVTTKALTANVATITTSAAHGLTTGMGVKVSTGDAVFDGNVTVASTPTSTTFTYARTNANVGSTASSGTVDTVQYRPIFFGIGRADGQLIRSQYLAGSSGFQVMDWSTFAEIANFKPSGATFNVSQVLVKSLSGDTPQLVFQVAGTNQLILSSDASYSTSITVNAGIVCRFQYSSVAGPSLSVGGDGFGVAAGYFKAKSGGGGERNALVCESTAGNPYDAFQARDTGGTRRVQINPNGYLGLETNSAPADGAINTSEIMFWFDNTPGATKLKFKGKDSAGTVRSGEVAMT